MKKLVVSLLATLLAGTLGVTLPAAPSSADPSPSGLTLTTPDLYLWPAHCGYAVTTVGGSALEAPHWDVTVTVHDPRGAFEKSTLLGDGDSTRQALTDLCIDDDVRGLYRVDAEYTTYDASYTTTGSGTATGSFTLGQKARSTSTVTGRRATLARHRWTLTSVVRIAGRPWSGHYVSLQAWSRGAWRTVATKPSGSTGTVVFNRKPTKAAGKRPMRVHSSGGVYAVDASSPTFRLPKR